MFIIRGSYVYQYKLFPLFIFFSRLLFLVCLYVHSPVSNCSMCGWKKWHNMQRKNKLGTNQHFICAQRLVGTVTRRLVASCNMGLAAPTDLWDWHVYLYSWDMFMRYVSAYRHIHVPRKLIGGFHSHAETAAPFLHLSVPACKRAFVSFVHVRPFGARAYSYGMPPLVAMLPCQLLVCTCPL